MTKKEDTDNDRWALDILQPLALGSFRNWLRLVREYGGIDRKFLARGLFTSAASLITIPFRLYERLRYGKAVDEVVIGQPPIFIIGHWRGGTTHLHNLLCLDPNFGYVTTLQTVAPQAYFAVNKTLRPLLTWLTPDRRMMDNVALSLDGPQEEEFAVANLSPHSFYHHWSFPRKARELFDKYALFSDITPEVVETWKKNYLYILRKASLIMDGKRLVLKNPANTGRIPLLLEMFPQAKFIHIYRNPYMVLPSTRRMYRKTLKVTQLQEISEQDIDDNILAFYREIMGRYLEDKASIPAGNLIEVRFEQLEADPINELRRIYRKLDIPGFEAILPKIQAYLEKKQDYKKNKYNLTREVIYTVWKYWRFAVRRWGYAPPRSG